MHKVVLFVPSAALVIAYFSSCNSFNGDNSISSDPATIANGEATFTQHCSTCHNFKQGGIGPQLGGLTDSVSVDWIRDFIAEPQKMIESGDARARQLFRKYRVAMPSFTGFSDDELDGIIAFLHTHKAPAQQISKWTGVELSNPIAEPIRLSDLVVGLEQVIQIPPSSDSGKLPLARITKLDFEPNTGRTFILDIRGKLYHLQNNKAIVYMDMAELKPKFIDEPGYGTGFGSFAFHPDFTTNGLLYTTHAEAPGSGNADFSYADSIKVTMQWVLTEWKTDKPGAASFSGTDRELFRVNTMTVVHGIQEIAFNSLAKPGTDDYGMLYLCIADGGAVQEGYPFLTHNLATIWGTIVRINPTGSNSSNGNYGIPPDNPFVKDNDPNTLGEIFAYGFKNPHRITWSRSGQMLVCNIGEEFIESVNLVLPGHDYGWPIREGTFVMDPHDFSKIYPLPPNDSIYKITYPIAQYDHEGGWTAISGGFEYSGTAIPQLTGKFLFGDIPSGRLFYINMQDVKQGSQAPVYEWKVSVNGKPTSLTMLCKNERVEMRVGKDASGELYILTKMDGKVYKLVQPR